MNGSCDRTGCRAVSDVRPVLLSFSPVPGTCPAKGVIGREYCAACARLLTVEDVMTDENWGRIVTVFAQIDKMPPDRSRLRLVMEPLIHAERN